MKSSLECITTVVQENITSKSRRRTFNQICRRNTCWRFSIQSLKIGSCRPRLLNYFRVRLKNIFKLSNFRLAKWEYVLQHFLKENFVYAVVRESSLCWAVRESRGKRAQLWYSHISDTRTFLHRHQIDFGFATKRTSLYYSSILAKNSQMTWTHRKDKFVHVQAKVILIQSSWWISSWIYSCNSFLMMSSSSCHISSQD